MFTPLSDAERKATCLSTMVTLEERVRRRKLNKMSSLLHFTKKKKCNQIEQGCSSAVSHTEFQLQVLMNYCIMCQIKNKICKI